MKTFKKFVESCEPINEAEYNKEWWDSKSDLFKKRYIERHPNSIYAQKAGSSMKSQSKSDQKKPSTSVKATNDLIQNKNSTSSDFEKAATVLLDKPKNEEPWARKVIALAKHPYTPESVIRRMEKEQPFFALHSPKASQEFLDTQVKKLDPFDDYTWIDALVQNPSLDTSQRERLTLKLKRALNTVPKLKADLYGEPITDFQKEWIKDRFNWQLDQLLNK